MDIVIEKADASELPAVLDFTMEHARLNEGFDRHYYALADGAESEYREYLLGALQDRSQAVLVARAGNEIVGCIQVEIRKVPVFKRPERGLIYNLYVKRMWRRRGIGSRLMDGAVSWLQGHGVEMAFLNVASGNEEAQRFYERLGFKTVNANMYRLM